MDSLPPELKARVCRYLSPKPLKMLRLVNQSFAVASHPFLLRRIIIYNRPESFAAFREVANHEIFKKYVTTVVFDTSRLMDFPVFDDWVKTKTISQIAHLTDDQTLQTQEHSDVQIIIDRRLTLVKAYWERHQDLLRFQSNGKSNAELAVCLALAYGSCPRLNNLVISSGHAPQIISKRTQVFSDILENDSCWDHSASTRADFTLWNILGGLAIFRRFFNSVSLNVDLRNYSMSLDHSVMNNLKHLRVSLGDDAHIGDLRAYMSSLAEALRAARSLETLYLNAYFNICFDFLPAIHSNSLRVCLFTDIPITEDSLVNFLLRHARCLQRIGLIGFMPYGSSWSSVIRRISRQLPALRRIQLSALGDMGRETCYSMDYEREAERFVMFGGTAPEPTFCEDTDADGHESREHVHPGALIDAEDMVDDLEVGLWEDYEEMAHLF